MEYPPSPDRAHYLQVDQPWHFRVRPDLIEELCLPDKMYRELPRTASSYSLWRQLGGYQPWHAPFRDMAEHHRLGYLPTRRWAFGIFVPPQENLGRAIAIDARGWWVEVEFRGVLHFVYRRAVEFLLSYGYTRAESYSLLGNGQRPAGGRRDNLLSPRSYIGYEAGSGLCQVVKPVMNEELRRYLQRAPDVEALRFPRKRSLPNESVD
ncbi:hypothetical protein [Actomonas aquatica]|uniref:N-acetyltransferase domain-containing protein n=1 Tax=Actomonas aquatica TaxID=2866162 RepID=A0ABZ1CAW5_9BACT|nr:hypothetical protein [Opitutus sp. WL0086]WRQ88606.1 hypothetical protein K1X11_004265 [Opitutus sp. WL0086]